MWMPSNRNFSNLLNGNEKDRVLMSKFGIKYSASNRHFRQIFMKRNETVAIEWNGLSW